MSESKALITDDYLDTEVSKDDKDGYQEKPAIIDGIADAFDAAVRHRSKYAFDASPRFGEHQARKFMQSPMAGEYHVCAIRSTSVIESWIEDFN